MSQGPLVWSPPAMEDACTALTLSAGQHTLVLCLPHGQLHLSGLRDPSSCHTPTAASEVLPPPTPNLWEEEWGSEDGSPDF